jgi:hypothetical protein
MTESAAPQPRPGNGPEPLTWSELDLLADWSVGELTGPDAARVTALVQADPRWAAARAALMQAEPLVRTSLHAAAAAPTTMPADVADRITSALVGGVAAPGSGDLTSATQRRAAPPRPGSTRPSPQRPPGRPAVPGRRRRWARVAGVAAGLALFVVGGGVALDALQYLERGINAASGDRSQAEGYAPPVPTAPLPAATSDRTDGTIPVAASGTDYQQDTLAQLAAVTPPVQPGFQGALNPGDPLGDFATIDRLDMCAAAVVASHGGKVLFADFARYEGEPAIVFLLREGTTSTVVAVGPNCGVSGAVDELAAVQVD